MFLSLCYCQVPVNYQRHLPALYPQILGGKPQEQA
jgi:hypothetical protein